MLELLEGSELYEARAPPLFTVLLEALRLSNWWQAVAAQDGGLGDGLAGSIVYEVGGRCQGPHVAFSFKWVTRSRSPWQLGIMMQHLQ